VLRSFTSTPTARLGAGPGVWRAPRPIGEVGRTQAGNRDPPPSPRPRPSALGPRPRPRVAFALASGLGLPRLRLGLGLGLAFGLAFASASASPRPRLRLASARLDPAPARRARPGRKRRCRGRFPRADGRSDPRGSPALARLLPPHRSYLSHPALRSASFIRAGRSARLAVVRHRQR
jgi:hypothetical protein